MKININKILIASAVMLLSAPAATAQEPEEQMPKFNRSEIVIENPEPLTPVDNSVPDIDVPEIVEWQEYIKQPFSQMKDKKLKQIKKQLPELPDCRSVRKFKKDFEHAMALKDELDGYWEIAKRPYEFVAVEETKERVYAMESRVNPEQARDIHEGLLTVLVRFRLGVKTLQDIVTQFEAIVETTPKDANGRYIRQPDTKRKLTAQFQDVINEHQESIQMRIKDNPYLRELYSGYVEGMRMNPFNTGLRGVRNQIMSQNINIPQE